MTLHQGADRLAQPGFRHSGGGLWCDRARRASDSQ